jgi:predicted Zn-dependent peptidase
MRKIFNAFAFAAGLSLAASASGQAHRARAAAPAPAAAANSIRGLVAQVNIPHQEFTLPNGLRVVVHEDHKAPVVAVSVWYSIGSKDEPAGRTGFAHLFEHLMFGGSEHSNQSWFTPMQGIGATDMNGTTWFDRTNYFETVPRAALETALFLESDRMGHLLGAVDQVKLDTQRGVVQNEKRQGDNQPFGLVEYHELNAMFPEGHPYHHSTIGSMADLDAASLATVQDWFRSHYGPNNAVLVLAGDITLADARTLVARYFGDIPRGPQNHPAEASVPTLPHRVDEVMHDHIPATRLYREWVVPGILDASQAPLDVAAGVLGGLSSSRLDNALVRGDQTAVAVEANVQTFHRISIFQVQVDLKPGADADAVSRRLDEIVGRFIAEGPTADEVQRYVTSTIAGRIRGLEQVGGFGGKAVALAEGALYANDPDFYRHQFQSLAAQTPATVRAAMQHWLTRPVYALRVDPGEREPYEEAAGAHAPGHFTSHMPSYFRTPSADEQPLAPNPAAAAAPEPNGLRAPRSFVDVDRSHLPAVGQIADLRFPAVEHGRLSNGIEIVFARRAAVPVVRVALSFNAGYSADRPDRLGLQSLMTDLLDEGTTRLNSTQIAEARERLGAQINTAASLDRTTVSLAALRSNLAPSLDLLADIVRDPAFAANEIERLRNQHLAGIASEMAQPQGIALRTLPPLLFGNQHPYGIPFTGSGNPQTVQAITRDDILAAHAAWIRPDNAKIFVVGDTTLAEIQPLLEARFGRWQAPATPRGTKAFAAAIPDPRARIILIDRPQSPQSLILAGEVTSIVGTDDLVALNEANDVLGGSFLSRLNMELRENKHWAYGAFGILNRVEHQVPYLVFAPVQADRTGDSIAAARTQLQQFLGPNGVTPAELERTINGSIRELPGSFETSQAVLGALQQNDIYRRPDDYYSTLASRLRRLSAADLDTAARRAIDPAKFVWVVVGDASHVRAQLEPLGLPIEVVPAAH